MKDNCSTVTPGVNRYWDSAKGYHVVKVLPGACYVTAQDELIATVLGSCVSACIRDPIAGVGGMNHFLLPGVEKGGGEQVTDISREARYGIHAMEKLINALLAMGAERGNLEVKLFGGGRIIRSMTDIGQRNIEFVRRFVEDEGLALVAEDLGDIYPRKVLFYPLDGRVRVRKLRSDRNSDISHWESTYLEKIEQQKVEGRITLF